jgi:hypothetical protein
MYRFTKLSSSPSLAPAKMDEIIIKRNILSSFITQPLADAAEAIQHAGEKAGSVVNEATKSVHSVIDTATEAVKGKAEQVRQEL